MTSTLKQMTVAALAITVSMTAPSCNNSSTTSTTTTADSTNTTAMPSATEAANNAATNVKEATAGNPDSTFVAEVVVMNNEEIKLLQEGETKGTDKALKAHAKMMIADHKDLKKKMEAYAAKKNYAVMGASTGDADKMIADMSSKSGKDWDKAWVDAMESGHEKTIGKFEGAKNQVKDDELKTMITATLPTLNSHLGMVKELQGKMK